MAHPSRQARTTAHSQTLIGRARGVVSPLPLEVPRRGRTAEVGREPPPTRTIGLRVEVRKSVGRTFCAPPTGVMVAADPTRRSRLAGPDLVRIWIECTSIPGLPPAAWKLRKEDQMDRTLKPVRPPRVRLKQRPINRRVGMSPSTCREPGAYVGGMMRPQRRASEENDHDRAVGEGCAFQRDDAPR